MTVIPRSPENGGPQSAETPARSTDAVATPAAPNTEGAAANAGAVVRGRLGRALSERISKIADKTASETVQASQDGFARAAKLGRENVLPEIERAGAKLKEHAQPDRLRKDYRDLLHWLHARVLDPKREQLFFVPTAEPAKLAELAIAGSNREHGHDYRPTPCQVFEWALAGIDHDLSQLTFVDQGAGKGRVMLLAAEHPFAAVGGVEFAEELHDNAAMNIAQYPRSRMRCRNVECLLEDASQVGPPDGEAIHYFFNPFSREVFAEVLNNIVVSYRQRPRRLYLILVDPIATDLVDACGVFTRVELPQKERLKVRFLSPYDVAVYRSLA